MSEKNNLNITFSVARVFAILSVAAAHIKISDVPIIYNLFDAIGGFGVTAFLIMSGFFYHSYKYKNIGQMIKSKIKTILIPWVVFSVLYYLWGVFKSGQSVSIVSYFLYFMGYKTFFYYLTILSACYLIFFKKNKVVMYISILATILSSILTAIGLTDSVIEFLHITSALNVLNYVGWFAVGYIMQDMNYNRIYLFFKKTLPFSVLLFILAVYFVTIRGLNRYLSVPYQIIGVWAIMSVSALSIFDKKIIHELSNTTFSMYLSHMFLIQTVMSVLNVSLLTKIVSPFVVVIVCFIILKTGYIISNKIKLEDLYCTLTGLRSKRNTY